MSLITFAGCGLLLMTCNEMCVPVQSIVKWTCSGFLDGVMIVTGIVVGLVGLKICQSNFVCFVATTGMSPRPLFSILKKC